MSCEKGNIDYGEIPPVMGKSEILIEKPGERNPAFSKDARLLVSEQGVLRGIITRDGSFDYTLKGREFFVPEPLKFNGAGVAYKGLFIEPTGE